MADPNPFQPVFLEPRDERWAMHHPERVDWDDQQDYPLVAYATAEQLETAFVCEDCFPRR